MGDFRSSARSSGLRFLLRLASVVAALVVLSMTSRASAAPVPNPIVPMCGERGESVAAPPIFRAYQPTFAFATPCHNDELVAGRSAPLQPERTVVQERPERVLGFATLGIAQSESSRLSMATAASELERPGFVDSLFRPPRR